MRRRKEDKEGWRKRGEKEHQMWQEICRSNVHVPSTCKHTTTLDTPYSECIHSTFCKIFSTSTVADDETDNHRVQQSTMAVD